jgi:hypothetical protein
MMFANLVSVDDYMFLLTPATAEASIQIWSGQSCEKWLVHRVCFFTAVRVSLHFATFTLPQIRASLYSSNL